MANDNDLPEILWHPSLRKGKIAMNQYRQHINHRFNLNLQNTPELQKWSVKQPHDFWLDLYSYLGLFPPMPPSIRKAYDDSLPMSKIPPWFEGLEMNYVENAVFANQDPDALAMIGLIEGQDIYKDEGELLTWREFRERVRQCASALKHDGIKKGDRVAAVVASSIWAIVLFHATASIGAVFTCISPELGVEGCFSRLQQVTPSILFMDSHTVYKGRAQPTASKLREILRTIIPKPKAYVIPIIPVQSDEFPAMSEFLKKSIASDELVFTRVSFNYPLMICYSSGTTGAPKCIVHRHGVILQFKKMSILHNCLTPEDIVMQFSSTSWIVFYGMCGHLSSGVTLVVYNGSPLYPDAKQLLRVCERYRVTFLTASPRLLLEMEMSGTIPKDDFDLSTLKTFYTTGAPLSPEQYKWFYRAFPAQVQINNGAGGTETAAAMISVDPCGPVRLGEMQIGALGIDVDIVDPVTGESIASTGEPGEMIFKKPFPSMPVFFWGDRGGTKYKAAYFERFENIDVWAQSDWLQQNPKTGGYVMSGRSDGTLNPSGIRFGSGEIYALIEKPPFIEYFSNTLCVGRRRPQDPDEQVFLFLVMRPGVPLTQVLRSQIKTAIGNGLSPRHIPKFVLAAPDIPMTINGKRVEVAVKSLLGGREVTLSATVSNPQSLKWFERCRNLEREPVDLEAKL